MSPEQAAEALRDAGRGLRVNARLAVGEALDVTLEHAMRLSSGLETKKDQKRKGHPYARRHGHIQPPTDPVIVNVQSGEFLFGWHIEGPQDTPGGVSGAVVNTSSHADLLEHGTDVMLGRPLPLAVEVDTGPQVASIFQRRLPLST